MIFHYFYLPARSFFPVTENIFPATNLGRFSRLKKVPGYPARSSRLLPGYNLVASSPRKGKFVSGSRGACLEGMDDALDTFDPQAAQQAEFLCPQFFKKSEITGQWIVTWDRLRNLGQVVLYVPITGYNFIHQVRL